MSISFGIHFGTTSICLAVCKDGKADVVANDAGDRVTPALVAFTDSEKVVGLAAKQGLIRNARNTACYVKRIIGLDKDHGIEAFKSASPAKVVEKDAEIAYEVSYLEKCTTFTARQVTSVLFKYLHDIADSHGDSDDQNAAVVSVPVHFTDKQKQAVTDATQAAGFSVLRVISEPSAALLAYRIGQGDCDNTGYVLVYRVGGQTMDVTVLAVASGLYRLVGSVREPELGGDVVTELLVEHAAADFQRQWRVDCTSNTRSMVKLRSACTTCKHVLSTMDSTTCSVDSLCEGIDFNCTISRARFEGLVGNHLQTLLQPLDECLKQARLQRDDISQVVLCGGTTRIPLLQKHVTRCFPTAEILCSIGQDEVIAIGSSLQASLLLGFDKEDVIDNVQKTSVSCLSADLGVQLSDGTFVPMLVRHTPIPCKRQRKLALPAEQTSALVTVAEKKGEAGLGQLAMKDLPGGAELNLSFTVKTDGSLYVSLAEVSTARQESLHIPPTESPPV